MSAPSNPSLLSTIFCSPCRCANYSLHQAKKWTAEVIIPLARTIFFTGCYASIALSIAALAIEVFFQITSSLFLLGILTISGYGLLSIQAKMENKNILELSEEIADNVGSAFKYIIDAIWPPKSDD